MKLLLLAGTGEARELAGRLAADAQIEVTASLAGATRGPRDLGVATRIGGFGGEFEQEKYIYNNGFEAVIDATHPFATQISTRSQAICARLKLAYVQLLRPGWRPASVDAWTFVAHEADVAPLVAEGATVFLATGRKTLERYGGLSGRRVLCRQIDPPSDPFPFAGGSYVVGRPPFSVEDEVRLFRDLGVDVLVVKDAGGAESRAKLLAARLLQLPVILIRRPPQPPGDKVESVAAALDWIEARL